MAFLPSLFSPAEPPLRLAIIGGRLEDDNRAVYREMRRLSQGRVLIFPTASSDPQEVGEETRFAFTQHGFQVEVAPLHIANAAAAYDPALVQQVETCRSVYFTGGDQALIFQSLIQNGAETPVLQAIRASLKAGGMLAGSSAGAAMMSNPMILGGTSFEAMAHGVTQDATQPGILLGAGLGFFPFGLVDQHFIKRGRLARLVVALTHAGVARGFGVDENTALIVEGAQARVCGEYGVFFVDMSKANVDDANHVYSDIRLTYLDDGDGIDLRTFKAKPGEAKRRVRKSEIAYRAPAHSTRNAFGAYALYDLVARMVLSDPAAYRSDTLKSIDPRSGVSATVEVSRARGASRCLIATPDEGLRITAVNLHAALRSEKLEVAPALDLQSRMNARTFGMDLNARSRIILLGSSPIFVDPAVQKEFVALVEGPVGIFAAASAEARRTAEEHVAFFQRHGVSAIDLGVTIDTVDYAAKDAEALQRIASMKTIFLCGGNQTRLVETLLHRGEESAVLQAIATAYANGAALIASGGAASALSGVMIAGGTTSEALRYGVSGHDGSQGLIMQEGVGLFSSGIADQNIISAKRLGRLVVACVENNERFGIGVCEESAVVAVKSGIELRGAGRYGFIKVETDPVKVAPVGDRFIARGIRLGMFGAGDQVNLASGHIERKSASAPAAKEAFERLLQDLMRDCGDLGEAERSGRDPSARHAIKLRIQRDDDLSAQLDLECAREEHDDA
jgi:cyanophycinase